MNGATAQSTGIEDAVVVRSPREVFDEYLSVAPLAHAIFRAAEVTALAGVRLRRPVLDLGCGGGQFARLALSQRLDSGLDLSADKVQRAQRSGAYGQVTRGDARDLPWDDGSFQTVVSISALEHMREPGVLLSEVHRVLRPGGSMVATIVLEEIHRHLPSCRLFRRLGLAWIASRIATFHDVIFRHVTLLTQPAWEQMFREAGFEITRLQRTVSPRAIFWWEILLITAWPYRILDGLGIRCVWRPRVVRRVIARLFRRVVEQQQREGACLLVVARKGEPSPMVRDSKTNQAADGPPRKPTAETASHRSFVSPPSRVDNPW